MFNRILVAIDKSDQSESVLARAIELAQNTQAQVRLVHVVSLFDEGYSIPVYPGLEGSYSALHDIAIGQYLDQWNRGRETDLTWLQSRVQVVRNAGCSVEYSQILGDPGDKICSLAASWQADLIVLGRRSHGGVMEFLLGSVSNYVMHHARCSVLTVQGQMPVTSMRSPHSCPVEQPLVKA